MAADVSALPAAATTAIGPDDVPERGVNRTLDRLVRTRIVVGGRRLPAFTTCGVAGLVLAWVLALALVARRGLPLWPMAVVALAAMATFLALATATKVVTGEERLVYYHHEVAVLAAAALVLRLLDRPVLPYLDATILGVGAFLACGRIGCLLVGCCHGRPARVGVRYRAEHAAAGFTPYYVGVRLLPIQAVESLWVLFVIAAGAALVWSGRTPGSALVWYVVAYDAGRFLFEFGRGDPDRPDRGGFSSAQWLSVLLTVAVVVAGGIGWLPVRPWHAAVAAGLVLAMLAVAIHRRREAGERHRLCHPHHVRELAGVLTRLTEPAPAVGGIPIGATSRGIRVSAGAIAGDAGAIEHYTLSAQSGTLSMAAARVLAGVIATLRVPGAGAEVLPGGSGVFHVVIRRSG